MKSPGRNATSGQERLAQEGFYSAPKKRFVNRVMQDPGRIRAKFSQRRNHVQTIFRSSIQVPTHTWLADIKFEDKCIASEATKRL